MKILFLTFIISIILLAFVGCHSQIPVITSATDATVATTSTLPAQVLTTSQIPSQLTTSPTASSGNQTIPVTTTPSVTPATIKGKILFNYIQNEKTFISAINADGSDEKILSKGTVQIGDMFPAWSPDGTKIAFYSTRDSYYSVDIYIMDTDGSNVTRVTRGMNNDKMIGGTFCWSPDSKKIVFPSGSYPNWDIYVINIDGTGQLQLTNTKDLWENTLSWSPDGEKIAYVQNDWKTGAQIWVMNADGSNKRKIIDDGDYPSWSPDSLKIVFRASDICVINADGTGLIQFTTPDDESPPVWSPDGSRIAFSSSKGIGKSSSIYLMNSDGSGLTLLTDNADYPEWSPDGKYILYNSDVDHSIYIIKVDGTGKTRLTDKYDVFSYQWYPR